MALGSCAQQGSYVNLPVNFSKKQNKLASAQSLARRSNANSNKALISLEASIPLFVSPLTQDLFTKFIKTFVKSTQAQD